MTRERFSLEGKNVVITGGAGILGSVFCDALLKEGAKVACIDQDQERLDTVVEKVRKDNPDSVIYGFECDISSETQVKETINSILEKFGDIHVLHNNAACKPSDLKAYFAPHEDYNFDLWNEIMQVNVGGYFLMTKYIGKHMVEKKIKGSIIQTSSIYGIMAPDQSIYEGSWYMDMEINTPAIYSASKAGVIGLTQYLASYWGSKGIRVNSIVPGGMESGQNDTFKNLYSKRIPLGRMGQPDELVGALIFLASDASSYITGHHLVVDGGLNCW
ncbi:MAG: SDR family oxidoreductase [Halobacteriovoraceae bacterium]|nr:SDR family oxidoreductase [Halobacteriovoraceae bacterium]